MTDTETEERVERQLPSGRFVLRIDPELHADLRAAAQYSDVSLNEYCSRKLASPGGSLVGPAAEVLERASALFGAALVGVVVFGSWARGEMTGESDVDVLVVVERDMPITRELYRRWDAVELNWDSHPVEPHFVHLPEDDRSWSGVWAEVAVEGVVLFDRKLSISRFLVDMRRRIVAGEIVRRSTYGQPYWVEAA